jgi:hypothetical protein
MYLLYLNNYIDDDDEGINISKTPNNTDIQIDTGTKIATGKHLIVFTIIYITVLRYKIIRADRIE